MPFGIMGRTGPGMRQAVCFGGRFTRTGIFGASLGRVIITNGYFTAYVCDSAATRPSSQITLGRLVQVYVQKTYIHTENSLDGKSPPKRNPVGTKLN